MINKLIFFLLCSLGVHQCFGQHFHRPLIDIDGNKYSLITYGDQLWMAENLRVTRFSNGDTIEFVNQTNIWENLETPAYSKSIEFEKAQQIGLLYNWYVIDDSRNICPRGWHVPTDSEWTKFINYIGGANYAGKILNKKSLFLSFFYKKTVLKTNFGVRFCGYLGFDGSFCDLGTKSSWWTKTENVSNTAWNRFISIDESKVYRDDEIKQAGLSIRCIKN